MQEVLQSGGEVPGWCTRMMEKARQDFNKLPEGAQGRPLPGCVHLDDGRTFADYDIQPGATLSVELAKSV